MKNLLDPAKPHSRSVREAAPPRTAITIARRFNRIRVPIDFSRPSLKAIPYALCRLPASSARTCIFCTSPM